MCLEMKLAGPADLPEVLSILNEGSAWMLASKEIKGHWPETWPEDYIESRIRAGEVYLAYQDGEPVGTLTLLWNDEETWPLQPDNAGYVYHLGVRRSQAGRGIGRQMLAWAAVKVASEGKHYLRLDCVAANPVLRNYYSNAGFTPKGTTILTDEKAGRTIELALFEKELA